MVSVSHVKGGQSTTRTQISDALDLVAVDSELQDIEWKRAELCVSNPVWPGLRHVHANLLGHGGVRLRVSAALR